MRQEALLAAISEKDANIALLELSSSKKKTQDEVAALKREKDRLVQQLKQQELSKSLAVILKFTVEIVNEKSFRLEDVLNTAVQGSQVIPQIKIVWKTLKSCCGTQKVYSTLQIQSWDPDLSHSCFRAVELPDKYLDAHSNAEQYGKGWFVGRVVHAVVPALLNLTAGWEELLTEYFRKAVS
ncbi:hypothetical protein IHE44_0011878 [Lamprotornis superbus]|uniref:Uncharacterized protein n=1 Tax=Lamprotornis superbus TaxID=245042 RepID=A0A835NUB6_9PASS|nr:hypothetical protein IHE44_0011878 [Lamprotornis superbus]